MYLQSITIKNFRNIKEATCKFNAGLNLIVGPNDSGKTAIIDAIRLVLRQIVDDYFRISPDDFNNPNSEINVDMVFSYDSCTNETLIMESAMFSEYLSFNSSNKPELNIWYTVKNNEKDIKFPSFKVGPKKEVAIDMDARCRENLKVVYLKPLRDAENELKAKQGSRISKILNNHSDITNAKDELVKILEDFRDKSEEFFDKGEGSEIKDEIKRLLDIFDEQATINNKDIKFGPTEKLDHLRTLERIALYYPDLPHPGLGTLNMIFIAAELLHLNTQKTPKLILVEEIEAHLHPQRQLKIIKALQDESKEKGIQMILSTHSPNLASILEIERLTICHDGQFYSLAKNETMLLDDNYAYLARFLDVTKANLFFARGVILVEGTTEQFIVPEIAKIIGHNLTHHGISVVSTHNLGFEHFVNIFKRKNKPFNSVPIAVITDADKRGRARIDNYINQIKDEENSIDCFVGDQLSSEKDISKNRGTTFEKIILSKTTHVKKIYIDTYNSHKKKISAQLQAGNDVNFLYSRIEKLKAPLAQEISKALSELSDGEKNEYKAEIETSLSYIVQAIKFVIPKQDIASNSNTQTS